MEKSLSSSRTPVPAWDMDPSPHYFETLYKDNTVVYEKIKAAMGECEEKMTHARSIHDKSVAEAKLVMYNKIQKAIDEAAV